MLGSEYNWLLAPIRSKSNFRTRLARRGLLTLGVATFCLACTFLPPASVSGLIPAALPGQAVAALDQPTGELPHVLIRLWFLLPQLLPGHN